MLQISNYIKSHEKLLIFILAFVLIYLAIGQIEAIIAKHDKANLTAQQAVLQSQVEKNNALAIQVQQQTALYQALADKVSQQNTALEQANIALVSALTKQQKTDSTMTPSELTQRWRDLVPMASPSLTANGVTLDDASAVATVQQLELIPVQQQEITSLQTELKGDHDVISAANAEISTQKLRIDGLNLQIIDETKVCSAQVATVKAEAAKSKRRWFIAGFTAGFVVKVASKILGKF
jgi:hypothetical protein